MNQLTCALILVELMVYFPSLPGAGARALTQLVTAKSLKKAENRMLDGQDKDETKTINLFNYLFFFKLVTKSKESHSFHSEGSSKRRIPSTF